MIPRKTLIVGLHFSKFGCWKPTSLKSTPSQLLFFFSLAHFLRVDIQNNSSWIARNMLSKEIKEVLQERGWVTGVAMELLKKIKRAISKTLLSIFSQYSERVLSYSVSMDRYQIRWLLTSLERWLKWKEWYLFLCLGFWDTENAKQMKVVKVIKSMVGI